MSTQAGTPNLDAALDAGSVIADTAASDSAITTVDESTLTDLEILDSADTPDAPAVTEKPADGAPAVAEPGEAAKPGEEAKPVEAAKPDDAPKPEDQPVIDLAPADKAVKDLREAIAKSPELKAALDKNPQLQNQLWRNARLAVDAEEFRKVASTPAIATKHKEDSEDLNQIEENFFGGTEDGYNNLLKHFHESDLVRGPDGKALMVNGRVQTLGHYDNFFHNYRIKEFYPTVLHFAKGTEKEAEVTEAIRTLQEFIGEGQKFTPLAKADAAPAPDPNDTRLTPEERAALAENASLKRQQAEAKTRDSEAFNQSVVTAVDAGAIDFLFKRAKAMAPALGENLQKKAASDAFREIQELSRKDIGLKRLKNSVFSNPDKPAASKRWVAETVKYVETHFRDVLKKKLDEYAGPVLDNALENRKKLETQAARTEVKGSAGAPTSTPAEGNTETLVLEGDKLMKELHNRRLSSLEVMDIEDKIVELRREKAAKAARR